MCFLDMIGGGGGEGETGLVDCWIFWIGCFGCRYIRSAMISCSSSLQFSYTYTLPFRINRSRHQVAIPCQKVSRAGRLAVGLAEEIMNSLILYMYTYDKHIPLLTYKQPPDIQLQPEISTHINLKRTPQEQNTQISWQQHHVFPSPTPQSHSGEQTSTPSTHTDPQKNYLLTVTFSSSVQVMLAHPLSIIF